MKVTSLQLHKLHLARDNAADVLREIKQRTLSPRDVLQMKELEEVVQALEGQCIQLAPATRRKPPTDLSGYGQRRNPPAKPTRCPTDTNGDGDCHLCTGRNAKPCPHKQVVSRKPHHQGDEAADHKNAAL